jgi:hypothetical protein
MVKKTHIDNPLLVPDVPDGRDARVERLGDLLQPKEGIDASRLLEPSEDRPDRL